eukprot:6492022-Amphidinium_carterae.1
MQGTQCNVRLQVLVSTPHRDVAKIVSDPHRQSQQTRPWRTSYQWPGLCRPILGSAAENVTVTLWKEAGGKKARKVDLDLALLISLYQNNKMGSPSRCCSGAKTWTVMTTNTTARSGENLTTLVDTACIQRNTISRFERLMLAGRHPAAKGEGAGSIGGVAIATKLHVGLSPDFAPPSGCLKGRLASARSE